MSKIAKEIARELFESFVEPWHVEAIDRALEGKIIKKSEIDALRKAAETVADVQRANIAEGGVPDLQKIVHSYADPHALGQDSITEKWEELVDNLQADLIHARREIVELLHEKDELYSQIEQNETRGAQEQKTIEPPACLKPKDVLTWVSLKW